MIDRYVANFSLLVDGKEWIRREIEIFYSRCVLSDVT
jgi:hypothetical protein